MAECSLDSLLAELLELGRATACLPVQFTDPQCAEYVQRVLEPLQTLHRHGWYAPGTMARIAQDRGAEALVLLEAAEDREEESADDAEE